LGRKLAGAAGLSCALELVSQGIRPGGNALNMGKATVEFGNDLSLIATLGRDAVHPLFRELTDACRRVVSLGEPGYTEALEFLDGKVMLNRTGQLHALTWDLVSAHISPEELRRLVETASLVGLLDWSIFPAMDEIIGRFLGMIREMKEKPVLFFDLSDLRRRAARDIVGIMDVIGDCGRSAPAILSLNESESIVAADALSIGTHNDAGRAGALRDRLGIDAVVVHPTNGAAVATKAGIFWADGPFCAHPAVSTGGGDSFNAGFCNGWLLKMEPEQCATLGAFTSGYYVRYGAPPGRRELIGFMETYGN
jgi:sugar/nucleoside kinase (ribokinase family)